MNITISREKVLEGKKTVEDVIEALLKQGSSEDQKLCIARCKGQLDYIQILLDGKY